MREVTRCSLLRVVTARDEHNFQSTDSVCFFVLCNRHWFNTPLKLPRRHKISIWRAPGPDPRGTEMGVTYLPSALAQTLAMPINPYPYWVPQSTSRLW
jgi:hypothetical protein